MSVLTYGSVRMQVQQTEMLGFRPIYTEDGVDYLYTELDFAVTAVVNPQALATAGAGNLARPAGAAFQEDAPVPGAAGDPLGISLRNLRPMLLTPRLPLSFTINGNAVLSVTGLDAKNGPLPQHDTRVMWITGIKTARVYFHVKTWVQEFVPGTSSITGQANAPRVVLANRYRVTNTMDDDYWQTRHVSGQLVVDIGQLVANSGVLTSLLTPDSFRAAAFLHIPVGFKRGNVQVTVSSDNTALDYSYTDSETPLALGLRSMATRIEGNATAGAETDIKSLYDVANVASSAASNAWSSAWNWGTFNVSGIIGGIVGPAKPFMPRLKANGIVRVWGRRDAQKADLALLALNVLYDRFLPLAGLQSKPRLVSLYVTQDIKERFIELRGEFMPTLKDIGQNFAFPSPFAYAGMMNMSTNILNPPPGSPAGLGGGAAPVLLGDGLGFGPLPQLGGTAPEARGNIGPGLVAMLTALLSTPGQVPLLPLDPLPVIDRPFLA